MLFLEPSLVAFGLFSKPHLLSFISIFNPIVQLRIWAFHAFGKNIIDATSRFFPFGGIHSLYAFELSIENTYLTTNCSNDLERPWLYKPPLNYSFLYKAKFYIFFKLSQFWKFIEVMIRYYYANITWHRYFHKWELIHG